MKNMHYVKRDKMWLNTSNLTFLTYLISKWIQKQASPYKIERILYKNLYVLEKSKRLK